MDISLSALRKLGICEGFSFVILLFVAMPVKYALGEPILVKIVGMAHGVLFMAYLGAGYLVFQDLRWPRKMLIILFFAATVPFGAFWFDRKLKALGGGGVR
jgi:integral membrane protein